MPSKIFAKESEPLSKTGPIRIVAYHNEKLCLSGREKKRSLGLKLASINPDDKFQQWMIYDHGDYIRIQNLALKWFLTT